MRYMAALLITISLGGCATPSVEVTPWEPQQGLMELCLGQSPLAVGETNESLAKAYLSEREARQVCQGVVRSLQGDRDGEEGKE